MELRSSAVIERPIEQVWRFFLDWDNVPKWDTHPRRVWTQQTAGPMAVGTTILATEQIGPFRVRLPVKVVEFEPYRMIGFQVGGPFKASVTRFSFERVGTATRVIKSARARGLLKLVMSPIMPILQRKYEAYMPNAKRALEAAITTT